MWGVGGVAVRVEVLDYGAFLEEYTLAGYAKKGARALIWLLRYCRVYLKLVLELRHAHSSNARRLSIALFRRMAVRMDSDEQTCCCNCKSRSIPSRYHRHFDRGVVGNWKSSCDVEVLD